MKTKAHKLYDQVKAPDAIPEYKVTRGERGVVVEEFEQPRSSVLVEYSDDDGRTKALAFYTPDLEELLDVHTL